MKKRFKKIEIKFGIIFLKLFRKKEGERQKLVSVALS